MDDVSRDDHHDDSADVLRECLVVLTLADVRYLHTLIEERVAMADRARVQRRHPSSLFRAALLRKLQAAQ